MKLPYETATSGNRAMDEIQKVLQRFGCESFGSMMNYADGELIVQFQYRDRNISVKASINGYAAAWLKAHALKIGLSPERKKKREAEAKRIASLAVYSILRDWLRGQITAIETGLLSFDAAFLGQILLSDGRTVHQHVDDKKLLPPPSSNVTLLEHKHAK